jgi:hypothetical protein
LVFSSTFLLLSSSTDNQLTHFILHPLNDTFTDKASSILDEYMIRLNI